MRKNGARNQFLDLFFDIGICLGFGFWDLGFAGTDPGFTK
jgi:hypothetical protein